MGLGYKTNTLARIQKLSCSESQAGMLVAIRLRVLCTWQQHHDLQRSYPSDPLFDVLHFNTRTSK
jgi:hypothetical protein